MSAREDVLNAFVTKIGSGTSAGSRVYRTRREQLPALPALVVEQAGIQSEQIVLGYTDHTLNVDLIAYASGDTPDSAADTVLAEANALLQADPSLGLSGVSLLPNYSVDAPDVEQYDNARLVHRYQVFYRTATTAI